MPTALVIDDQREMADSLAKLLSLLGVDVKVAYGARSAMQILQTTSPEIVFLDINMPAVDGFEVFAYLRRIPAMRKTPVVVVTSDDQPETRQRVQDYGALALVIKPASYETLAEVLEKANLL
ncbi:MAG: response regulator [Anaerolineales bacterium]|nr:response regulator [Anaerolineales bacterium]